MTGRSRPGALGCRIASSPAHAVACCVPPRAAPRTNTRRASRSGAHIRACSSAGRVLAERCLGISRLVVLVCVRQQLAWVERPLVDRLSTVRRRESALALSPSGADGAPQRRTEIFFTESDKPRCTCPSRRILHTSSACEVHRRVRGPCRAAVWVCLTAKSPDHVSNANTISCSSLHYSVIRVWCTYRQVSEARRSVTSQDRTPLLVIHNTHSRGLSRCVVPWQRHPVLAIDGFTTHTSRSLPSSPLPPGRGAARRPVEDLPARTRHRVQDLVQATADNHRRTGQATRRERYHTEPGIARDGRACARLATAGGPPRGAPARMASCRRGRHESGFGALVAKARSGRARTWKRLCTPRAGRYLRRQPSKRAW